jgi:predicted Fe-S protein YdhL (DUF1289 family)
VSYPDYPRDLPSESAGRTNVPSPCINVCEMDSRNGLCKGCLRTIDEIASWSLLDDATRSAVLDAISIRRNRSA